MTQQLQTTRVLHLNGHQLFIGPYAPTRLGYQSLKDFELKFLKGVTPKTI